MSAPQAPVGAEGLLSRQEGLPVAMLFFSAVPLCDDGAVNLKLFPFHHKQSHLIWQPAFPQFIFPLSIPTVFVKPCK